MIGFGETRAFFPVGPRVPGIYRAATIGDSITYGAAVPPTETLASHLAATLNAAFLGLFFETVNLGRNGSNFWQAWSTFEYHFAQRGFDAAILSICSNDTTLLDGLVDYEDQDFPWDNTFQFSIFVNSLRRVKNFADQHKILVIINYFSFLDVDIPRISLVQEACRDVGLPFIDMRKFLVDEVAEPRASYCASALDGHPSGHVHALAARRIVDEIAGLRFFPDPIEPVDLAEHTWRLAAIMREYGRPKEECWKWCTDVLESKSRSWQRRLTRTEGIVLGDATGVTERNAARVALWRRRLALHAWFDTLTTEDRSHLWLWLQLYAAHLRNLDELLCCLESITEESQAQSIDGLILSRGHEWVRTHFAEMRAQPLADFQASAEKLRAATEVRLGEPSSEELPGMVAALVDLTGRGLSHIERYVALLGAAGRGSAPEEPRLKAARVEFTLCQSYLDEFLRSMGRSLSPDGDGSSFYTNIDVLVEAKNGTDEDAPRTFLYVSVDYKRPVRCRIAERQLCGFEKKRWLYSFQMPFFALADVEVYVPAGTPSHDRFLDGRTVISEIRIYDGGRLQRVGDDAGFHWTLGNSAPCASIFLKDMRPQ